MPKVQGEMLQEKNQILVPYLGIIPYSKTYWTPVYQPIIKRLLRAITAGQSTNMRNLHNAALAINQVDNKCYTGKNLFHFSPNGTPGINVKVDDFLRYQIDEAKMHKRKEHINGSKRKSNGN